jgi:hypothetical protein
LAASYVDQQIAAAGVWKRIRALIPPKSAAGPSWLMILCAASTTDPLVYRSAPHTPYQLEHTIHAVNSLGQTVLNV